jgi:hypothetical protein
MRGDATSASDPREFCVRQDQDLLVLTDAARYGRDALALPFRHTTVIEVDGGEEPPGLQAEFDTIAIDRAAVDLARFDAIAGWALAALRPDGRIIITLDPADPASTPRSPTGAPTLAGLEWDGLAMLNGRPCALLRAGEHPDAVSPIAGALLTTAEQAFRLAAERSTVMRERAATLLTRDLDARHRSEDALFGHLDALAGQLDEVRRRHQGRELMRTVLRRFRVGRGVLRVLRPYRRLAGGLRRRAGGLRRRLGGGRSSYRPYG